MPQYLMLPNKNLLALCMSPNVNRVLPLFTRAKKNKILRHFKNVVVCLFSVHNFFKSLSWHEPRYLVGYVSREPSLILLKVLSKHSLLNSMAHVMINFWRRIKALSSANSFLFMSRRTLHIIGFTSSSHLHCGNVSGAYFHNRTIDIQAGKYQNDRKHTFDLTAGDTLIDIR